MFQHVAVDHPPAGVVGDEGDFDALVDADEHGVAQGLVRLLLAVSGEKPKGVTVQVDRMLKRRAVFERDQKEA
jgi:hypothetical protein